MASSLVASITKLAGFEQNPYYFLRDFIGKLFFVLFLFYGFKGCFLVLMIFSLPKGFDSVDSGNGFVPLR